jgi:hypothetical protein
VRPKQIRSFLTCAALTTVVAVVALPQVALAQPEPSGPSSPAPGTGRPVGARGELAAPDAALGSGWRKSSDALVTGIGDTDGFHVYIAREKDAFAWATLATLKAPIPVDDSWVGYVCVTGSGNYAVAVYAPAGAVNRPELITAGASAAVVDTRTGSVRHIAEQVELAYFNPSCGPGDQALLTRSVGLDNQATDLLEVDAAAGKVTKSTRIDAQLTTPVPGKDGNYGIVRHALVRVGASGSLQTVATPDGQPFAARATADGNIDLLTVQRERTIAYRYAGGNLARLGDAQRGRLGLFGLTGGRNALVGDVTNIATSGRSNLQVIPSDQPARSVSQSGHLLALTVGTAQSLSKVQAGGRADATADPNRLSITVKATHTGTVSGGAAIPSTKVSVVASGATSSNTTSAVSPLAAVEPPPAGVPTCAIGRNDVHRQAFQPSANQVEWAVDLAVHGELMVQRPANFLKTGQAAYRPQSMFPLPTSGPQVPAQIMLAILAQESNMSQASWHAVPGDGGNPLIADYYGNRSTDPDHIAYGSADCGYGIGQVTDGMRTTATTLTTAQQVAIATDYAANIAASVRILADKWTQLKNQGTQANNYDPQYIENWFLPVWGYNSGVYAPSGSSPYGVGWLNNPANPRYPADRESFLRVNLGDTSHPADWSYPEKIMGWAEVPQWQWIEPATKYSKPNFGTETGGHLTLPGRYQFCDTVNNCAPGQPTNPCPAVNSSCWWHGHTSWLEFDSVKEFATENRAYPAGSSEPAVIRTYPTSCTPLAIPHTLIVDDLANSGDNVLGCAAQPWGGKFTIRAGNPPGSPVFAPYGQVDLHQLGAGYLGHAMFTYAHSGGTLAGSPPQQNLHQVIGTWTPSITQFTETNGGEPGSAGIYQVMVHLPSHGARALKAKYIIKNGLGNETTCEINQSVSDWKDTWVYLGAYALHPGASVQLNNMVDADVEVGKAIAYDAMAFTKIPNNAQTRICGERDGSPQPVNSANN